MTRSPRPSTPWTDDETGLGAETGVVHEGAVLTMVARARLDAELVRRGLARSREQARELVDAGSVRVNGTVASKAATGVTRDTPIVVDEGPRDDWASRGAHKLLGALEAFPVAVEGRRALDLSVLLIGGSTFLLTALGLVMVLSSSSVEAIGTGGGSYGLFLRQTMWAVAGLAALLLFSRLPIGWIKALAWPAFGLAVVLLKRGGGRLVLPSRAERRIAVIESRRISPHADLCLLRCDGQEYVILSSATGQQVLREGPAA